MTRAFRLAACAWTALGVASCQAVEPQCAPHAASAALTNGTARAEYLGLDASEEAAVADIQINPGTSAEGRCTGALIAERSVLTAKHCIGGNPLAELRVSFGPDADGRSARIPAEITAVHPALDALVITLRNAPANSIDVAPLAMALELPPGLGVGSLAQLAGYGQDAEGELGVRSFLVATVLELTDEALIVGSGGWSGACFGDSGGPLLMRAANGHGAVAGVLRRGSVSCFGRDTYTRVDALAEWLTGLDLDSADSHAEVGGALLGRAGRCFDDLAVWSEAGGLRAKACGGERECGFSARHDGYRCVDAGSDPCDGIRDVGACEDEDVVARCEDGRVALESCAACGLRCARSPATGVAGCYASASSADGG